MPGRLLVTGSDGFTGCHLVAAAESAGYEAYTLKSDLTQRDALGAELAGAQFEFVIHLAGISAVTHEDEAALYMVNLFGTLNLLDALRGLATPPDRVILASSANVYGNAAASPITETARPSPANHYAMSKLAMEHMTAAHHGELPLVTTRPFNYTGRGHDERFVIPKLIRHFKERLDTVELGNLQVEREFNDVRDVCEIYLRLMTRGEPGQTYNICSGRAYSLHTVIDTLRDLTGHTIETRVNPAFVRSNELHTLCGDPAKLVDCVGAIPAREINDTLKWMLQAG